MAVTLYALLVGINEYRPPVPPLRGCVADVQAFATFLRARRAGELELRSLLDAEATRDGFIDAVRSHLGRAGEHDVALLYFAGHGSEEPVPPELSHLESGDDLQTLVLADTGQRVDGHVVRPLADKELAVLLDEVSAGGGHVAVILDCCHAGDADRDVSSTVRAWEADPSRADEAWRDVVAELRTSRAQHDFLGGALEHWTSPPRRHVTLCACRAGEKAKEEIAEGGTRGVFSLAFDRSLELLGHQATYRTILATVRSRVERAAREQRPQLAPEDPGGPADAVFLDGAVTVAPASFTMTRAADGWRVDGGLVHGLRAPDGDAAFVLACVSPAGQPAGAVRVTAVDAGSAAVEPLGWVPDDVAYAATVVDVPFPPADVQLDPPDAGLQAETEAVAAVLRAAVATAGPGGRPSPDLRIVGPTESHPGVLRLRVAVPEPGRIRLRRADGTALASEVVVGAGAAADLESAARLVVARLAHVVRWERVRLLGDHPSALSGAVVLELFASAPDEARRPTGRPPLPTAGGYRLAYEPDSAGGGWRPPYVFAELVNRSDDPLFVAVLDLTDRYRCDVLFETDQLAPGKRRALFDGHNLSVTLPEGRAVRPGASARDWLQVIVSEVGFSASAFELPALDEPPGRAGRRGAVTNALERVAARATSRDVEPAGERPAVARWSASTITLEVTVPTR